MNDLTRQTKKRRLNASQSSDNSGDESKKRGRPRVEKQDESAADRRRTQIRKAQRAYRQRKESTLEELRRRVADLSNVMELMNKAFVDCCGQLITSGLSPQQASHVRDTEMRYESLMRGVRNPEEGCSPELVEPQRRASVSSHTRNEAREFLGPKNVPSWMDEAALISGRKDPSSNDLGMGYTLYANTNAAQATVPTQQHHSPQSDTYTTFRVEAPMLSIEPPPRTYSFQETTFARRLHRATLEAGYQLVLDPNIAQERIYRAFRLSLMTVDRAKLTLMLKSLLDRGPDDSLDSGMPMVHVGGAGTHYSRKDKFGVLQPKKQTETIGTIGPRALSVLEHANLITDLSVEITGFEGEWFDPHDVEGYLAEKGIFIDPGSSFAEADVNIISRPSAKSSSTSTTGTTMSPEQQSFTHLPHEDASAGQMDHNWQMNADDWSDFSMQRMTDIGFSDASTGSWMNFLLPGEAIKQRLPSDTQWDGSSSSQYVSENFDLEFGKPNGANVFQKKRTLIDVAKFVKALVSTSCCLGRLPGYRREDVDRALTLAAF